MGGQSFGFWSVFLLSFVLMKKLCSFLILTLMLGACTPEIKHQVQKDWQALKNYDVLESLSLATGFREAFPNNKEKMIRQDRDLCLHEDAHQREITANGLNDQRGYNYCTLTPAGMPETAHRWDGR